MYLVMNQCERFFSVYPFNYLLIHVVVLLLEN